jgi:uncharacterized membrane protein
MTTTAHLWAIGYDDMERAEQVRARVAALAEGHCLTLLDTAVVVRFPDGSATLDGEQFVAVPSWRGHYLARCLAGLMLGAPPLTGAAVRLFVRRHGDAAAEAGIDGDFLAEVEALMKPGTSALFVLDREGCLPAILRGICGLGGTVIRTNVDLERLRLVESALAAAPAGNANPLSEGRS